MFHMDSSDDDDDGGDDGHAVQQESPQEGFTAAVVVEPGEPEPLEGAPTQEQGDGAGSETEDDTDAEEAQVAHDVVETVEPEPLEGALTQEQGEGAGSETEDDTDDEEAQVAQLAAHAAPALAAQPANSDDHHEGAMQQHLGDATQPPDDSPEISGVPLGTAGSEIEADRDEEEAAETAEDSAAAAATAIGASVHKAVGDDDYMRQAREKAESEGGAFDDEQGTPDDEMEVEEEEEEDEEEDAEGEGDAGASTASELEESGLMELFALTFAVCYDEYYELMASWRPEGGDWLLTDCRRVYRLRRQATGRGAGCSGDEPNELPPLPCAALKELQSAPFEDGGFVSQHLQTEPENGLFVLAVLFGWKVSDDALEVYVDAAAREEARNCSRSGRAGSTSGARSGRGGGRAGRNGRTGSSRGGGSSGGGGSSSGRCGGSSSGGGASASGHGGTKRPLAEQDQGAESDSSEGQSVD